MNRCQHALAIDRSPSFINDASVGDALEDAVPPFPVRDSVSKASNQHERPLGLASCRLVTYG